MSPNDQPDFYDYIRLIRMDHWFKNIFILPGFFLAYLFSGTMPLALWWNFSVGWTSVCLLASANYVINEWLDRHFDRFHPIKKDRAAVQKTLNRNVVIALYLVFAALGLLLSLQINSLFFVAGTSLLAMGVIYNVQPFRAKDRLYLDVLVESINNPIRFMLGWAIVAPFILPPVSVLLAYWMGGAYLMGIKRYSEYRYIHDPKKAALYRRSFGFYSEKTLLVSSFFYALSSTLFLGVFLIKYHVEYILLFPFLAVLFAWYLRIGLNVESAAQRPEKLYKERGFMVYTCGLTGFAFFLTFQQITWIHFLLEQTLVNWKW